jgi:predicted dehydrogenase
VRVLIVGHGRMGKFHRATVQAAGDIAVTLDPHAPAEYRSWLKVQCDFDAAIIAAPIDQLYAQAITALRHGIPRVLIEKPGASSLEQALELHNTAPDLAVGYIERLNPVVAELAARVEPGSHVTYTRNGPHRGPLGLDAAAHDIDLHYLYFPGCTATILAERSLTKQRTIQANGYTADLVTRTLRHPDGTFTGCHQDDLLAEQWDRFRQGRPAALIADAVAVHRALAADETPTTVPLLEAA